LAHIDHIESTHQIIIAELADCQRQVSWNTARVIERSTDSTGTSLASAPADRQCARSPAVSGAHRRQCFGNQLLDHLFASCSTSEGNTSGQSVCRHVVHLTSESGPLAGFFPQGVYFRSRRSHGRTEAAARFQIRVLFQRGWLQRTGRPSSAWYRGGFSRRGTSCSSTPFDHMQADIADLIGAHTLIR